MIMTFLFVISGTAAAIAAIVAALAASGASLANGYMSAEAQKEANRQNIEYQREVNAQQMAYNSAEAEKQRQWEEYMSSTAVQRSMKDYEAAGLNPLLAVPGGASYGGGFSATANLQAPSVKPASGAASAMGNLSDTMESMSKMLLTLMLFDKMNGGKNSSAFKTQLRKQGFDSL